MPEFAPVSGSKVSDIGANTSTSLGTVVTSDSAANTKGPVVELTGSTTHDAYWISIQCVNSLVGTANYVGLLDILIGAATEQVLIADLPLSFRANYEGGGGEFLFPLFIPKGSRLSARYQAVGTGTSEVLVTVRLYGGSPNSPLAGCTYVDRYGGTSASRGTGIDPGGTSNTYSAWEEIAASTLRPIRWLVLGIQHSDLSISSSIWIIQVGIGSATEQVIAGDFLLTGGTTSDNALPYMHFYLPIFIPAGSRLSVRAKYSGTIDGDRDIAVSLFGAG